MHEQCGCQLLRDYRTTGLRDYGTTRPRDYGTTGPRNARNTRKNGALSRVSCIPRSSGLSILAAMHNFLPPSVKKAQKRLTTDFTDGTDGREAEKLKS